LRRARRPLAGIPVIERAGQLLTVGVGLKHGKCTIAAASPSARQALG
jgi:hypothetical protein